TRRGALILGGPRWPPKPPSARHAPAEPWRSSISRSCMGPETAPQIPSARHAPAGPWRSSISRSCMGPEMVPQTPQRSSRPGRAVAFLDLARPGVVLRVAGTGAVLEAHARLAAQVVEIAPLVGLQ